MREGKENERTLSAFGLVCITAQDLLGMTEALRLSPLVWNQDCFWTERSPRVGMVGMTPPVPLRAA